MTKLGDARPGAFAARGRPTVSDNREVSNELLHAMEHGLRNKSHLDLTTREIASAAGTNAGMIHYYYHGKNGLIDAALDNLSSDIAQTLNDLNSLFLTDCQDATRKIVSGWMNVLEIHRGTASVVLIESFRPYSTVWHSYRQKKSQGSFNRMQELIRTLVRQGYYRADTDPQVAAFSIISIVLSPLLVGQIMSEIGHKISHIMDDWENEAVKLIDERYRQVDAGRRRAAWQKGRGALTGAADRGRSQH